MAARKNATDPRDGIPFPALSSLKRGQTFWVSFPGDVDLVAAAKAWLERNTADGDILP